MVVKVAGRGFTYEDAHDLISSLEVALPVRNPGALEEILEHLRRGGTSLEDFKVGLLRSIGLAAGGAPATFAVEWHPHGTDNQIMADAEDIVEKMAEACAKSVRWSGRKHGRLGSATDDRMERSTARSAMGSTRMTDPSTSHNAADALSSGRRTRRTSLSTLPDLWRRGGTRAKGDEGHALFISYFREEAGCDARYLQAAPAARLNQSVFLDASDADHLDGIITDGVERSAAVLLVQTKVRTQRRLRCVGCSSPASLAHGSHTVAHDHVALCPVAITTSPLSPHFAPRRASCTGRGCYLSSSWRARNASPSSR